MTQEEIEGNKLIAEFKCTKSFDTYYDPEGQFHFEILDSKYHSSWSWLMPVVEKISKIPLIGARDKQDVCYPLTFGMPNGETGNPMVRFNGCFISEATTLMEATWLAVVAFIKWYNLNKQS